jgi:hypothetical protein
MLSYQREWQKAYHSILMDHRWGWTHWTEKSCRREWICCYLSNSVFAWQIFHPHPIHSVGTLDGMNFCMVLNRWKVTRLECLLMERLVLSSGTAITMPRPLVHDYLFLAYTLTFIFWEFHEEQWIVHWSWKVYSDVIPAVFHWSWSYQGTIVLNDLHIWSLMQTTYLQWG